VSNRPRQILKQKTRPLSRVFRFCT
jgi:hypothetical protein